MGETMWNLLHIPFDFKNNILFFLKQHFDLFTQFYSSDIINLQSLYSA